MVGILNYDGPGRQQIPNEEPEYMSADHFFIATMQSRKSPVIEERCHHAQKR